MPSIQLRHILLFLLSFTLTLPLLGQDLLASQVPISRKMRAVDSVALNKAIRKVGFSNYESNELYPFWVTNKVHCYNGVEIPETYKIDLRGFTMPTPSRVVTSGFGYRPTFRRMHKGIDIKVYTGDTIVAAFEGKVRVVDYEANGYGYYVVIRHKNGLETIYAHLSKQLVSTGEVVKSGQVIGLGGNTGHSFGSHLHFETRFLGIALNPALIFDFPNQDVTGDYFVYNDAEYNQNASINLAARIDSEISQIVDDMGHEEEEYDPRESEVVVQGKYYQVKREKTLAQVAQQLSIPVESLANFNGLQPNAPVQKGQILRY